MIEILRSNKAYQAYQEQPTKVARNAFCNWLMHDALLESMTATEAAQVWCFLAFVAKQDNLKDLYNAAAESDDIMRLMDTFNRQMRQAGSTKDLI